MKKKLVCVLACRNQGSRLYGKPLQNLDIKKRIKVIDFLLNRIKKIKSINSIVLAISDTIDNQEYIKGTELKDIVIKDHSYLPTFFLSPSQVKESDSPQDIDSNYKYVRGRRESNAIFNKLFPEHDVDKIQQNDQCPFGECNKDDDGKCAIDSNNSMQCNQLPTNQRKVKISCEKLEKFGQDYGFNIQDCKGESNDFNNYKLSKLKYDTVPTNFNNNRYIRKQNSFYSKLLTIKNMDKYLIHYNKFGLTVVKPFDSQVMYSFNNKFYELLTFGCQFICMNYQIVDDNLKSYLLMFKDRNTSFLLKPEELRLKRYRIPDIDLNQIGLAIPTEYYPRTNMLNNNGLLYGKIISISVIDKNQNKLYLTITNSNNIRFSSMTNSQLTTYQLFKLIPSDEVESFYIKPVSGNYFLVKKNNKIILKSNINKGDNEGHFYSLKVNLPEFNAKINDENSDKVVFGYKNLNRKFSYIKYGQISTSGNLNFGLKTTNEYHNNLSQMENDKDKLIFEIDQNTNYRYVIKIRNNNDNYLNFNSDGNKFNFNGHSDEDTTNLIIEPINVNENYSNLETLTGFFYLKYFHDNNYYFLQLIDNKIKIANDRESRKIKFSFRRSSPHQAEIRMTLDNNIDNEYYLNNNSRPELINTNTKPEFYFEIKVKYYGL